jgi:hypothetical protein
MKTSFLSSLRLALLLAACHAAHAGAAPTEHREFEATLNAPYRGDAPAIAAQPEARTFTMAFDYPGLETPRTVTWRLELAAPSGAVVQRWRGTAQLRGAPVEVQVRWRGAGVGFAPAVYRARLVASVRADDGTAEEAEQSWDIAVGQPAAPAMPRFAPLPRPGAPLQAAPATGALPYTVYLGNLHSQTNHSDGGADLGSCKGAQEPQSARFGPEQAFDYARQRGLDLLVASEHNHMYDGSDGTNPDADPAKASALYRTGLEAAKRFSSAHPDFLAVYGLEWGVINKGGHLNIFNSPELLGWEANAKGQLLADTRTPRNDYGALYTLMRSRGWVGQFNHPATSGQFLVNGVALGYSPDGDQVMALCEVLNSTAFSTNVTETETRRSNYEEACNKVLEAGYHVAFSTNQDNHCANWGASYTNRTGVLIPTGTALTHDSFIEALKARRVFATMDKASQLVLTANGKMMGERFTNSGPLTLVANFASTAGKTVGAVAIMEGVPGRNGTVTQMSDAATSTFTPAPGEHFYYAKVTQSDGNVLWSAPVWVTQTAPAGR